MIHSFPLLAEYLPHVLTARTSRPPPRIPECRDAMDLPFMHLAVAGRAEALVSGDGDLQAIAPRFGRASNCPVLSLKAFVKRYLGA